MYDPPLSKTGVLMISAFYGYVSNAVTRTVETVQNNRVTQAAHRALGSTTALLQNTVQGCLELYIRQEPVGEVEQADPNGEVGETWEEVPENISPEGPVVEKTDPNEQVGETWQEPPESILPKDPLAAAIPAPQPVPIVVLNHQDDLFGPRTRDIDLKTVDLKALEKSSTDIRARHAARKAGGQ